jgi:CHAT domain-containing protein/tetratricopeptide (TPR) repeat protein
MSQNTISSEISILRNILAVVFSIILLTLTIFGQAKPEPNAQPLTVEKPVERELKGDEVHSYSLALQAGQFLNVVVEQKGVDVVVALFDSNNRKIAEVDSPNGTQGEEPLSVIIEQTGNYRLEVRSLEKTTPAGRYEAKIKELRAATDKDKTNIAANKAFNEALSLYQQGTAATNAEAIKKYEEAVSFYRAAEDRQGEANSLSYIGTIYNNLGDKQQALKFHNEALPLFRALGDKYGEAVTLTNIGAAYVRLGDYQQSLKFLNESLPLFRGIGDKYGEAATVNNIGTIYDNLGDKQQALKFLNESLPLRRAIGDKNGEATTLNNIGKVYVDLGDYQQALKFYSEALPLSRAIGDKQGEAIKLSNIGDVYGYLGNYQQALKFQNEALLLFRTFGDKYSEATTLNNIGKVYVDLGDYQQALKFYSEALPLRRTVGNKSGEAATLNNIGTAYAHLGNHQQALKFYNEGLPLIRAIGEKRTEATTLMNIGLTYGHLDNKQQALKSLSEAMPLMRAAGDKSGEAFALMNMGLAYSNSPRLNIFFNKQSVNNYQIMRSNVQELDKKLQQSFLKSVEKTYRQLADSLTKQQRHAEAQQVLNAFKDQQFFDFSQSKQLAPLAVTVREAKLTATFNQKLENVVAAIRALDEYKRGIVTRQPTADETAQIKILEDKQTAANEDYLAFLKTAEREFAAPPDDKDKFPDVPDLREMQTALRETSSATKQNTVTVYTLVGEENFHALIITPDGEPKSVSVPLKNAVLNEKAKQFWALLQSEKYDTTKLGKELYDIAFAPIEKVLPADTKTILWSLDGNLRYVPMAALFDGKRFLVERYNHVNFTRADKERMTRAVSRVWTGTGFGTSKPQTVSLLGETINFNALPGVDAELKEIFKTQNAKGGILEGSYLPDAQFNREAMLEALKQKRPLVHIASHFSFRPGDESRSFLLMGDGTPFTLDEMKKHTGMFEGVELLTLSACNTAAQQPDANGRDVDAFFELAQRLGAGAVLATLWSVADNSTPHLMRDFYALKQNKNLNKAEALRRAQISLLKGTAKIKPLATRTDSSPVKIVIVPKDARRDDSQRGSEIVYINGEDAPVYNKAGKPAFAHPFYWSPFILFGNWK